VTSARQRLLAALQRPRAAFPAEALLRGPARSRRRRCAAGSDSAFRRIAGCKDEIGLLVRVRAWRRSSAASPRGFAASAGRLRDARGSPPSLPTRGVAARVTSADYAAGAHVRRGRRASSFRAHADHVRVHLDRGLARPGVARLSSGARVPARRLRAVAARDSPFEARRRQAESTFFLRQCFA
jgi:hypothetical protein